MNWQVLTQEWYLLPQMAWEVLTNIQTLLGLLGGGILGMIGGMLPGISAVMAMTLMLGFVFQIPVDAGMGLLVGIYTGAIYGGSITAILLNMPGTPAAAATVLDGHAMARKGKSREAVGIATWSSFFGEIGGELGTFILLPFIATAALMLGDWEIFLVALIGLTLAGALGAKNPIKGWIAAFVGWLVAIIGTDPIWGTFRYGYSPNLMRGIEFIPVLIGLFGVAEVLWVLRERIPYKLEGTKGRMIAKISAFKGKSMTVLRSIGIGLGVGIVPGVGESVAPWLAYDVAERRSKHREKFGKGYTEGLIAPEVANNATSGGALIPMLVLGLPGSGPTAVMMAALFMYGIRPGPMLIIEFPGFIAKFIFLFWVSAVIFRLISFLLSKYFIKILSVRRDVILPVAIGLGVIGAWGVGFNIFDVSVMFIFGLLGYIMRLREFPMAPMVLGVMVGGTADQFLRRALMTYSDNIGAMFARPIGLFLLLAFIIIVYMQVRSQIKERNKAKLKT
ncbi:MAG: tripartite tricarboxylate transporter permease [Spirochaetia bacterium]|nr:tripartite tricarboxylate transporter permease [Spirochaetia bacterium]MCF7945313.1 tripartite tricarboxylate transporter permease [Spirochaetia bacterium]MCF7946596.1 tripartite tricarboxylate transporter permease [Spirochaetia bacterium]